MFLLLLGLCPKPYPSSGRQVGRLLLPTCSKGFPCHSVKGCPTATRGQRTVPWLRSRSFLCRNIVRQMMLLWFYKFPKWFASPWMIHWWYVSFLRCWLFILRIEFFWLRFSFGNFIQYINRVVVYGTEETAVKSLDYHGFSSFSVMFLHAVGIQHPVVSIIELNTVSAVYGSLCQNGKGQVDGFFRVGLSNICYSEDKKSSSIWFGVFQPSGLIGKRL